MNPIFYTDEYFTNSNMMGCDDGDVSPADDGGGDVSPAVVNAAQIASAGPDQNTNASAPAPASAPPPAASGSAPNPALNTNPVQTDINGRPFVAPSPTASAVDTRTGGPLGIPHRGGVIGAVHDLLFGPPGTSGPQTSPEGIPAGPPHGGGALGRFANGFSAPYRMEEAGITEKNANAARQYADIRFQSVQAAHLAAQTALLAKQTADYDQDHKNQIFAQNLENAKAIQTMTGVNPTITTDEHDSITSEMANQTATKGGVPPAISIQVGPNQWMHFDMNQVGSTGGKKLVDDINTRMGQPVISQVDWQKLTPEQRIKQAADAATRWAPSGDPQHLEQLKNDEATIKALPDTTPDKADSLAKLAASIKTSVGLVKQKQDLDNAASQAAAKAKKTGENEAPLSPLEQSTKAKNDAEAEKFRTETANAALGKQEWKPKVTADEKKKAELAENIAYNAQEVKATLARRPDLVGKVSGRITTVEQMIGNNDPDISALGNHIHNMAMANSGVHGFRSQEGVKETENNLLNQFKNGPAAVDGAVDANVASVQTFIDNARPDTYPTHSKNGGAGFYYQGQAGRAQNDAAQVHAKMSDFKQVTPTKEHGNLYTDDGKTWYTQDGHIYNGGK